MSIIPLTILPRGNIFQGFRSLEEWVEKQRSQDCEALLRPSMQQWLVWMSAIALWSHWGWREEVGYISHPKDEASWKWESEQLVVNHHPKSYLPHAEVFTPYRTWQSGIPREGSACPSVHRVCFQGCIQLSSRGYSASVAQVSFPLSV